jgi:uncharacterized protein YjbI with pentapeptide repeats
LRIFISHHRADNDIVDRIQEVLDKYKIEYWVDKTQIYTQISEVNKKIREGLKDCTHFLLLYSSSSSNSEYVKAEVRNAISKKDLIKFSLRLDNTIFENEFKKFEDHYYERIDKDDLKDKLRNFIFQKVSKDCDFISQIRILKDKVRYDFEHFPELKSVFENVSVKGFTKFDTYNEFISQRFRLLKTKQEKEDILKYIIEILKKKDAGNFIPVVGNYGSGKSTLSFYTLYHLCEEIMNDEIIPIYIPLGKLNDYRNSSKPNLIDSILNYISVEYKITNKKTAEDYLEKGNFILILDALDELSLKIDPEIIEKNIDNIISVSNKGNRVLLTSRYTYLTKNQESKFIDEDGLIEILDFDSKNRQDFINRKIKNGKLRVRQNEFIEYISTSQIEQITSKPLFLQIICDNYEDFRNIKLLNPALIFEKLTGEWIIHDVNKNEGLSSNEKKELKKSRQRISESLALFANKIGFDNAISIEELKNQVNEEFASEIGYQISNQKLSEFYRDAKDSTFLTKEKRENNLDTYSFIYKPVVEYLVARRIVDCINDDVEGIMLEAILQYSQQINSPETIEFIGYIVEIDWSVKPHANATIFLKEQDGLINRRYLDRSDVLFDTVKYAKSRSKNEDCSLNPNIGNLINIIYSITGFGKFNFRNKGENNQNMNLEDLSNCNLESLRLINAILPKINMAGANLRNANLTGANLNGANLSHTNLENAKLNRADLHNVNLEGSRLYFTDFTRSNLVDAVINSASLIETNFTAANLERADFSDVNRQRPENDWAGWDAFYDLDLSLSIFHDAKFFNAFLPFAIIINPGGYINLKGNKDTDFNKAVIDDYSLICQIGKFTKNIPQKINTKSEISEILNAREESPFEERWLRISKLPD